MIRRPQRLGATFLIGSVFVVLAASTASAAVEPPLVSGHAEVVAQGIVDFPGGTFHWQVAERNLATADGPTVAPDAVTFVVADAGIVDISGGGARYRLATGEAAMLQAFPPKLLSTAGDSAEYWALSIADAAQTDGVGASGANFTLDAGPRDVDLIRDVLAAEESLTIPDQDVATLVLVTGGAVSVAADGAVTDITTGNATTLDGTLTITNTSTDPATIVAAVIASTAVDSEPPTATSPPTTGEPSPAPTTTAEVTTTSAASTDTDGDGLSDADETGVYGTDPNNQDSEGDHVMDGDEVNVYGTDPLDNDSDNDFSTDGDEVDILGTDPTNPDTDGDGLIDSNESPYGADPNNFDTDGDGSGDGVEVGAGTNPADATSFP
jgi:Bacterial TSP3 repeat